MAHKILAIDDHADTLDIVVMTLKGFGYEVVSTQNPVESIHLAEAERPDLALIDMNMPVMNGIEVVKKLRQHPELGQIPIIMFTAENQPDQKKAGFAAGVDDYLFKPTEPAEMIARIEEMLENIPSQDKDHDDQHPATMLVNKDVGDYLLTNLPDDSEAVVIGILGMRGGVGTTMVAINTALLLASRKQPVTLIDLDLQQGHIGFYLNRTPTNCINTLVDLSAEEIEQQVLTQITPYHPHLQLLLARPNIDGRFPFLSEQQIDAVLNNLSRDKQIIVADLGHSITPYTRPILTRADQILLCLEPDRLSLSITKHMLSHIKSIALPTAELLPVLVENGSKNLPQEAIEGYIGRKLRAIIPFSPTELAQSINKGSAVIQLQPKTGIAAAYYHLAKQLPTTNSAGR